MLTRLAFPVLGALILAGYLIWFTETTPIQSIVSGLIFLVIALLIEFIPRKRRRDRRDGTR